MFKAQMLFHVVFAVDENPGSPFALGPLQALCESQEVEMSLGQLPVEALPDDELMEIQRACAAELGRRMVEDE